jgi:hypothetical protein
MMQETTSIVRCTTITTIQIVSIFMDTGVVAQSLIGTLVIELIFTVIVQMSLELLTLLGNIVGDIMNYKKTKTEEATVYTTATYNNGEIY